LPSGSSQTSLLLVSSLSLTCFLYDFFLSGFCSSGVSSFYTAMVISLLADLGVQVRRVFFFSLIERLLPNHDVSSGFSVLRLLPHLEILGVPHSVHEGLLAEHG